jgi:hypothetical protein
VFLKKFLITKMILNVHPLPIKTMPEIRALTSFYHFFLAFMTIKRMSPTTRAIRIKAHHMPALKIPPTTLQLLNAIEIRNKRMKISDFMVACFS